MKRAVFSVLLGLLGLGLFFTSVALAAPSQPLASPAGPVALFDDPISDTDEISSTTTTTHPVAAAIAAHFSDAFTTTTTYADIMALHEGGLGFGVIAKAYFAAQKLQKLGFDVTPQMLLDEFAAGTGWGQIMKNHDLHPGRSGREGNLGDIMSGHKNNGSLDALGAGRTPPGQLKKGNNSESGVNDQANGDHGKGKAKGKNK
jgi:hypothetical protein